MRERSRRRFLGAAGAGLAGLLAGCSSGNGTETPTSTATPTPSPTSTPTETATPVIPTEPPAYWDWLPTPTALEVERYRLGSLQLEPMRDAGAARNLLAPGRYVLSALKPAIAATRELLTLSNDDFGTGLLRGDFDVEALRGDLADADFEAAETDNRLVAGDRAVDLGPERIAWAEHPSPGAAVDVLLARRRGRDGESYPATAERLETALGAVEPADARFATHYLPPERTNMLAGARFHANGMAFDGEDATWRLAVTYANGPPGDAEARYREAFAETEGFTVEASHVDGGLLTLRVATSTLKATATQPY